MHVSPSTRSQRSLAKQPRPLEGVRLLSGIAATLHAVRQTCLLMLCCWALPVLAATYPLPRPGQPQVVGQDVHIKSHYKDTLYDLAEKYGVGSEEMVEANPHVDPWLPGEGTDILIPGRQILPPGPRRGIIVNIPEHRLYYFPPPGKHRRRVVITYPVSIGSMDWKTPIGLAHIIQKIRHPTWHPPVSIRKEHRKEGDPLPLAVPPGPRNPLGAYAMRLDIKPGDYLIHGTNNPIAVGMPVTHGCIRLYPRDIAQLFARVPVGTEVRLMNDPVKVAVDGDQVLLEAHPPVDSEGQTQKPDVAVLEPLLHRALRGATATIDWDTARDALKVANGVLVTVGFKTERQAAADQREGTACTADALCSDADKGAAALPAHHHAAHRKHG